MKENMRHTILCNRQMRLVLIIMFLTGTMSFAEEPNLKALLDKEIVRSSPDHVVYVPKSLDGVTHDTGNEHFLVFDGPDGSLMAVWTQSSYEGAGDHRIMFSRSDDEGVTWSSPLKIAGPEEPGKDSKMSTGDSRFCRNREESMSSGTRNRARLICTASLRAAWTLRILMISVRRGLCRRPFPCPKAPRTTPARIFFQTGSSGRNPFVTWTGNGSRALRAGSARRAAIRLM